MDKRGCFQPDQQFTGDKVICAYPPVGSVWEVDLGPDMKRIRMKVIASGHGSVCVQQFGGKYIVAIDIQAWMKGPYQPEQVTK